ncbi:MAG: metallophosphoesterase family protein [Clostridia bacterium]|nr:metallophosphoesterase family protein [Clostridia bacterium]
MRTLILSDIHGNLPALEAVLATPEARSCGDIVSLGDHVSFCAQSREVHQRLASLGATMLLGNHEERLTRPADAEFGGYNWAQMRWTAAQMKGIDLHLPADVRRGGVLFTHGTPGDPYHLVYPDDLPGVLDSLPEGVHLLLSGHNHHRWDVTHDGRRAFNPGSVGLAEDSTGSVAPFAVLEDGIVTRYCVPYDAAQTIRAFIESGLAAVAPEMCRACVRVLLTAEYQGVLKLIRHVIATADGMGLTLADHNAWLAADRTYSWQEPLTSTEYWKHMEESL